MVPSRPRLPPASLVDYGVIGDLTTAALISKHGGLDWLCLPRLDAPAVFSAILDDQRGGRLRVAPNGKYDSSQSYLEETNILRTDFVTPTGRARLTAFMPVEEIESEEYASQELHLTLDVTQGTVEGFADFHPRFNFGLALTRLEPSPNGILASATGQQLAFASDLSFRPDRESATAAWSGNVGDRFRFVLRWGTGYVRPVQDYETAAKLQTTERFWRTWVSRCSYHGPSRDAVRRSALALKLLAYAPTGALAAAATTSLPEEPGGARNWDYRFSWVRDSSFAIRILNGLGYTREARRYLRWLRSLLRGSLDSIGSIRVCYGLEGEADVPEVELGHLEGFLSSRPVRVGNAAFRQFQLDTFGSLQAAIYDAYQRPGGVPDEAWRTMRAIADFVAEHWEEPDHGIWEVRGPKRRYTHSALMSWVALDRAIRAAQDRRHAEHADRWQGTRDQIRTAIETQGWSPTRNSFVQTFGSDELDASLLMMPLVGFLPATDRRIRGMLDAIERDLTKGPFVYRYRSPDGLAGDEGAFLICSFWFVHALALAGRVTDAQSRFDALLRLAGPLGIFSEEVDPRTGQALGNLPQALTHLSHIGAALALDAATRTTERRLEDPVTLQ